MAYRRVGLGISLLSSVKQIQNTAALIRPVTGTATTPNPPPPGNPGMSTKAKIVYGVGIAGLLGLFIYGIKKK